MKSWWILKHGGSTDRDVYEIRDSGIPSIGDRDVLVQIRAVSLNRLDLWVRNGVSGHCFPLPLIPGSDGAGVIEAAGNVALGELKIRNLFIGSEVILNPARYCGACFSCVHQQEPLCKEYKIQGESISGCASHKKILSSQYLELKPTWLTFAEAAAFPIPTLTAWSMLVEKAKIKKDDLVLIRSGGSGVSIMATQIAKYFGATVVNTVSSQEKRDRCLKNGADFVIISSESSVKDELKKLAKSHDKSGADIIVDHAGSESFSESLKMLNWGGRLVTCGATSGSDASIDLKMLFFKNLSIFGTTMGSTASLREVLKLAQIGILKPVIQEVAPFEDFPKLVSKLENRENFGKLVLVCSS